MKTVTSEDNLSTYFMQDRQKLDYYDMNKLNKKIKSIKTALKIAEKHNQQLHMKIKNLKENHQLVMIHLESEAKKYKQLYEMLVENYELRSFEVKEYKKKLKKLEIDQIKCNNLQEIEEIQETAREFKEALLKQEKEIFRVKEENKLLYQQIYEKSTKLKEFEQFMSKSYASNSKMEHKDKSFLINLKMALQSKNQEYEKMSQEKSKLTAIKNELQKENGELTIKIAKVSTELEYERKSSSQLRDKILKLDRDSAKLLQENKQTNQKYNELLNFSYDSQKEFEKELHIMAKQLTRKEIVRSH